MIWFLAAAVIAGALVVALGFAADSARADEAIGAKGTPTSLSEWEAAEFERSRRPQASGGAFEEHA